VILNCVCPSQDLSLKSYYKVSVRVWIFKIICSLHIDPSSNSEYIVLNDSVIVNNELKTCAGSGLQSNVPTVALVLALT